MPRESARNAEPEQRGPGGRRHDSPVAVCLARGRGLGGYPRDSISRHRTNNTERELLGKDFVVCEVMPYAMRGGDAVPCYLTSLRRAPPKERVRLGPPWGKQPHRLIVGPTRSWCKGAVSACVARTLPRRQTS